MRLLSSSEWSAIADDHSLGVFYTPEYSAIAAKWEGGRPECLYTKKQEGCFIYPYVRHQIPQDLCARENEAPIYDIQTAYGYGGPMFIGSWSLIEKKHVLWDVFKFLEHSNVIAEFIRSDPDHCDVNVFEQAGYDLKVVRTNVESDHTTIAYDKCGKRNQRTAQKAGLTFLCLENPDIEDVKQFHRLYHMTAERLSMDPMYRFDLKYFISLLSLSKVHLILIHAPDVTLPVAGSILFLGEISSFHFLGAHDRSFSRFCPNDYQYSVMINESKKNGSRKIVWGGGTSNNPDDSLFNFKKHYGNIFTPVHISCRIINESIYHSTCVLWRKKNMHEHVAKMDSRFLKYRF